MGIGGIFFKAADKTSLAAKYRDNLGAAVEAAWAGAIFHCKAINPIADAPIVWRPFAKDTDYFAPSAKHCMVNFRVADLDAMYDQLRNNQYDIGPATRAVTHRCTRAKGINRKYKAPLARTTNFT